MELPFSNLLDVVRSRGVPIGVAEHLALARLLVSWRGCDARELRDAICALLARSEQELVDIGEAFDLLFGSAFEVAEPKSDIRPAVPAAIASRSRRRLWPICLIVGIAIGVLVWRAYRMDAPGSPSAREASPVTTETAETRPESTSEPETTEPESRPETKPESETKTEPKTEPETKSEAKPPMVELRDILLIYGAVAWLAESIPWGVTAAVITLLAGMCLLARSRNAFVADNERGWETSTTGALDALPGARQYRLITRNLRSSIPRADLDDFAQDMSIACGCTMVTRLLDVQLSIDETVRTGLAHLAFGSQKGRLPVLLMVDTSPQMEVWSRLIDDLSTGLTQRGVQVERWDFEGTPDLLSSPQDDLAFPVRRLRGSTVPHGSLSLARAMP